MENVNLWVRTKHEYHKNWAILNSNDSTVTIIDTSVAIDFLFKFMINTAWFCFCFIGCEAILRLLGKLFHSKVLRLGGKIWHSRGSWSESPQNHGGWKQKTPRRCSERTEWGSQGKDYFQILVSEMFIMLRVTDC